MFKQTKAERVLEAFQSNCLIGRAKASGETSTSSFSEESEIFINELNKLYGLTPIKHERKDMSPHVRAGSASLMVSGVPMFMFNALGLLFDGDKSLVRALWLQDAWTLPDAAGWGKIDAYSGIQGNSPDTIPTLPDLAKQMRQLYADYISNTLEEDWLWENSPVDDILARNEIKANFYQEGLIGLFFQKYNTYEHICIKAWRNAERVSQDWEETFYKIRKFFIYQLQQTIAQQFNLELPIFEWDYVNGNLVHWTPTPEELDDLANLYKKVAEQKLFFDLLVSGDATAIEDFLSTCQKWNIKELIQSRSYNLGGHTPLIIAVKNGNLPAVIKLYELGADDKPDHYGKCLMEYALEQADDELAAFIIGNFKVNHILLTNEKSPLFYAVCSRTLTRVEALIAAGAIIDFAALYAAAKTKQTEIENFLISKGAPIENNQGIHYRDLIAAEEEKEAQDAFDLSQSKNEETEDELEDNYGEESEDNYGEESEDNYGEESEDDYGEESEDDYERESNKALGEKFASAISHNDIDAFNDLLATVKEAKKNINEVAVLDCCPLLIYAIEQNAAWAVKNLLSAGANINATYYGETAHDIAIEKKYDELVEILDSYGQKTGYSHQDYAKSGLTTFGKSNDSKEENSEKEAHEHKSPGQDSPRCVIC